MRRTSGKNCQALVTQDKYRGKYVAFAPNSKKIIASGSDPGAVIEKARSQGVEVPAIVFVPEKNVAYVY